MAITINGDGTLTGISVGGLPDGIVDTDMLATSAVATAKIADDAVSAAKLASGAGGKIVQVKAYMTNGQVKSNANGGAYLWGGGNGGSGAVNGRIQFTPTDTSNQLILSSSLGFGQANLNGGVKWLINGDGSSSADYWQASATSGPQSTPDAYYQAFNTSDDTVGSTSNISIVNCGVTLVTKSDFTLPTTIDFGLFYYSTNPGYITFNQTQNGTGDGQTVSTVVVYEVESL